MCVLAEYIANRFLSNWTKSLLRDRPYLPPDPKNGDKSVVNIDNGVYPLQYSCPCKGCYYHMEYRKNHTHHIAGWIADKTHRCDICTIREPMTPVKQLGYISEAVAVAERDNLPKFGLEVTRRVLRGLYQWYCDPKIYAATCFAYALIRTSIVGYKGIDLGNALRTDNPS